MLSSEHVAEYTRAALQENAATGDAEGMAARRLVERAIHHQSSDNVSVAVASGGSRARDRIAQHRITAPQVVVVSLEPSEGSAVPPQLRHTLPHRQAALCFNPPRHDQASPDLAQESPDLLREDSTATQSFSPGRRVASSRTHTTSRLSPALGL